jgi:hypothetical protein
MTDRELLELAAKAAGEKYLHLVPYKEEWLASDEAWNPLKHNSDAFMLSIKLNMDVAVNYGTTTAETVETPGVIEKHEGDPYAATRRAIVRAAAEIGKAMP